MVPKMVVRYRGTERTGTWEILPWSRTDIDLYNLGKGLGQTLIRSSLVYFWIRFYNLISMFVLLLDFEMNEFGV